VRDISITASSFQTNSKEIEVFTIEDDLAVADSKGVDDCPQQDPLNVEEEKIETVEQPAEAEKRIGKRKKGRPATATRKTKKDASKKPVRNGAINLKEELHVRNCTPCQKAFHLSADELKQSGIEFPRKCGFCSIIVRDREELTKHVTVHKPYFCSRCFSCFGRCARLRAHNKKDCLKPFRVVKDKVLGPKQDQAILCAVCDKTFTQKRHYLEHVRIHTGEKPYKCELLSCNRTFRFSFSLKLHMRRHNDDRPYACKYCPKKFFTSKDAHTHEVFSHTRQFPIICEGCGKGFIGPAALKKHQPRCQSVDTVSLEIINVPTLEQIEFQL